MRSGSLYVHEPSGANDHQDSFLGGHGVLIDLVASLQVSAKSAVTFLQRKQQNGPKGGR